MNYRIARLPIVVLFLFLLFGHLDAHVGLSTRLTDMVFNPGDQIMIEWEVLVEHDPVDWDLDFSTDGGETWEPLEPGLPLYQHEYTWIAPDFDSRQMLIRIVQDNDMSEDYYDVSDTFSILPAQATAVFENDGQEFDLITSPNPASSRFNVALSISRNSSVFSAVYNQSGQLVHKIAEIVLPPGHHQFEVDATNYPAGVFILVTKVNGITGFERILVIP